MKHTRTVLVLAAALTISACGDIHKSTGRNVVIPVEFIPLASVYDPGETSDRAAIDLLSF